MKLKKRDKANILEKGSEKDDSPIPNSRNDNIYEYNE